MYYAQFTDGICTAVTQTAGELPPSIDCLRIQSLDTSLLGKTRAEIEAMA